MELFVDNFAGGGGASTGIEMAIGRSVDIAINHDPDAIAMHRANHPNTKHYCEDVWQVNPKDACKGNEVALAWFSPDCKHFSRAKGGTPVDKNIRGLAWVTVKWAYEVRPRVIMLENVPEIMTWGPLITKKEKVIRKEYLFDKETKNPILDESTGYQKYREIEEWQTVTYPDPKRTGETFNAFVGCLTTGIDTRSPAFMEMCNAIGLYPWSKAAEEIASGLGYQLEFKVLKSCDYGAPTTRTRFYMIARCDGKPIIWPEATHAAKNSEVVKNGKCKPYRTVAECIDWSIPTKSIFEREKPLAENTLKRIARGIQKFVIDNPEPFIVTVNHGGDNFRGQDINEPLQTVTAKHGFGVVEPIILNYKFDNQAVSAEQPLSTVTSVNNHYLVAPTLIQYHSEQSEKEVRGQEVSEPIMTIDTAPRDALSVAHIMKNYAGGYTGAGSDMKKPLDTVTAKDHNSLVTTHIMTMRNNMVGQRVDEPLTTISCSGSHHAEVQAFLIKYFSNGAAKSVDKPLDTITTKDRFAVVSVHGEDNDSTRNYKHFIKIS